MLSVPLSKARCGMKLAMPVHHPLHPGHVLLKPGFELDASVLRRMRELKVPGVWIHYPALEDVVRYVSPEIAHEHAQLTRVLSDSLEAATRDAHAKLDFSAYADAVRSLVRKLGQEPGRQLLVSEMVSSDRVQAAHASNVCLLSLLMGLKLEGYLIAQRSKLPPQQARCVENLGVGALVHDVGVLHLPGEVVDRFAKSGDENDPEWQRHVELGVEAVQGRVEPSALAVVAHHHQRYDGQGFPWIQANCGRKRLSGAEIHVFARIAHVADAFDRLRNAQASPLRRDGQRPATVSVLRELVERARRREIDPIVVKGLVAAAPAFTPGAMVTLNDGRHCVVTSVEPLNPCRPEVRELRADPHLVGTEESSLGEKLDLHACRGLHIVESEGCCVEADLFEPEFPEEFDLRFLIVPPRRRPAPAGAR